MSSPSAGYGCWARPLGHCPPWKAALTLTWLVSRKEPTNEPTNGPFVCLERTECAKGWLLQCWYDTVPWVRDMHARMRQLDPDPKEKNNFFIDRRPDRNVWCCKRFPLVIDIETVYETVHLGQEPITIAGWFAFFSDWGACLFQRRSPVLFFFSFQPRLYLFW